MWQQGKYLFCYCKEPLYVLCTEDFTKAVECGIEYLLTPFQRFVQAFVGGYYNRYYLTELDDGCSASAYRVRGHCCDCAGYQKDCFKMQASHPWRVSQKHRRGGAGYGGQFCLELFGSLRKNILNYKINPLLRGLLWKHFGMKY